MTHQTVQQTLEQPLNKSDLSSVADNSHARFPCTELGSEAGHHTSALGDSILRKESSKSSLCRSPGWEDSRRHRMEKQEAKDKRKRHKEEGTLTSKEKKQKQPGRLRKAPPTSNGQPRLSASLPRSNPEPVINSPSTESSTGQEKRILDSRLVSDDLGSGNAVPWKSATDQTCQEAQTSRSARFIGGRKLQQTTQAAAQHMLRKEIMPLLGPHESDFVREIECHDSTRFMASSPQNTGQGSFEPKLKGLRDTKQDLDILPIRGQENNQRQKRRASDLRANVQKSEGIGSAVSKTNLSLVQQVETAREEKSPKLSTSASLKRPPISYREPAQLAETKSRSRRGSFSSLIGIKQPSKSATTSLPQEDSSSLSASSSISTRHRRGRSWSFSKSSRTSISRPTTAGSFDSEVTKNEINNMEFLGQTDQPNPPGLSSRSNENLQLRGKLSLPSHLKTAAKAAFSKFPTSSTSAAERKESFTVFGVEKVLPISTCTSIPNHPARPTLQSDSIKEMAVPPETLITNRHGDLCASSTQMGGCSKLPSSSNSSAEYHSVQSDEGTADLIGTPEAQPCLIPFQTTDKYDQLSYPNDSATPVTATTTEKAPSINHHKLGLNSSGLSSHLTPTHNEDLSFLPPLRHKTLKRSSNGKDKEILPNEDGHALRQNRLPAAVTHPQPLIPPDTSIPSSSPPSPVSGKTHSARYLHDQRQSLPLGPGSKVSLSNSSYQEANAQAKMFVICCKCRFFHDMPSKIYEYMAKPENIVRDPDLGVGGVISTRVKCPWCAHGMRTTCCEGWAAVVLMKERLH